MPCVTNAAAQLLYFSHDPQNLIPLLESGVDVITISHQKNKPSAGKGEHTSEPFSPIAGPGESTRQQCVPCVQVRSAAAQVLYVLPCRPRGPASRFINCQIQHCRAACQVSIGPLLLLLHDHLRHECNPEGLCVDMISCTFCYHHLARPVSTFSPPPAYQLPDSALDSGPPG